MITEFDRVLAEAGRSNLPPTEARAVQVAGTWWAYAEGTCEGHARIVHYSRECGYQRHLDGTPCEEIILPLGSR